MVERIVCWLADRGIMRTRIEEAHKRAQLRSAERMRLAHGSDAA